MIEIISIIFLIIGLSLICGAFFIAKRDGLKNMLYESAKLQIDDYEIEEDNSVTDLYDDMSFGNIKNSYNLDEAKVEKSKVDNKIIKKTIKNKKIEETEILRKEESNKIDIKQDDEITEILFTEDEVTELLK